jgi:hypothetical protein
MQAARCEIGNVLAPSMYALFTNSIQWAAVGGSIMRYTTERLPTEPLTSAPRGTRFFPETGHSLAGEFRTYYETHGIEFGDRGISARESLGLFGYPVSEPFDEVNPETGQVVRVQYFERARMELHPANPPAYRVLLGRLGVSSYLKRYGQVAIPNPNPTTVPTVCQLFAETSYPLCPPLRTFWQRSGGLPVFGFPITAAADEVSVTDGKTYLTQWYERERLEYHPENRSTPYEVLLGLLGSEELRQRAMLP